MVLVLIEHMERASRWVQEEYLEAARIAYDAGWSLMVTGVVDPVDQAVLASRGLRVTPTHSWEVCDTPKTIVLDLWASKDLEPWEARVAECFVVGGIMGDHPPRRRGLILSAMFDWAARRRLGEGQLSVDGTIKVLTMVWRGLRLEEIHFIDSPSLEVETSMGSVEVTLPFRYPLKDGRPWISPGLARLLASGLEWDES